MASDRSKHPSGRPKPLSTRKEMSRERGQALGPLLPRLRIPEPKDAIGFVANFPVSDDED